MLEANRAELEKSGALWWHGQGFKGKGVTIAVVDFGCPRQNQADYVEYPFNETNKTAHGCNVCAVIHAVAPEAKVVLLPFDEKSIDYIIEHNIKLVSISLNFSVRREWFEKLKGKASVFCSAGNDPSAKADYPSKYDWTITVGSFVESSNKPAPDSTPCADIVSYTYIAVETDGGKTFEFNGTSAATPFARGLSALVYGACLEAGFEPTISQLHDYVLSYVVDVYTAGEDLKTGKGLLVLPERLPRKVVMTLDKDVMQVNGQDVKMDKAMTNLGGLTFIPLRAVGQALGATVDWDNIKKQATITSL